VVIDSTLAPGSLTYGEIVVPGRTDRELIVSTHVCHPSLCDDNLSGIAISAALAAQLASGPPPSHTIRFVYAPGTIGAITWLARHRDTVARIDGGLTLTCLGDTRRSRTSAPSGAARGSTGRPNTCSDAIGVDHEVIDFFPYGYDERQYNSPGFRAPVGSLMRGRHGQFPEYHTSADNLAFVRTSSSSRRSAWSTQILRVA
jgi:aminopeptidase-like protein